MGALIHPGVAYFARKEAIAINTSLKILATTHILEEGTDATKEHLEVEDNADKEMLDNIIFNEVTAKTQKINPELGQSKRQMNNMENKHISGTGEQKKESKNLRRTNLLHKPALPPE